MSKKKSQFKEIIHCLLEQNSRDGKLVWTLISTGWGMVSEFMKYGISNYTVYSRLSEFLYLFIVKLKTNFSKKMLTDIKAFVKKNEVALYSFYSLINDELAKQFFSFPENLTKKLEHSHLKVWHISPVKYFSLISHCNSAEVAQQLSIIDFDLYISITARELGYLKWDRPQESIICHNVITMIRRINSVAHWVATVILSYERKDERAAVMKHFVLIASHLLKLKNFSSFMGVMSGLNMSPVTRLRETKLIFEKNTEIATEFEELMKLQDPTGSFAKLREKASQCGSQVIPYIGTCLADLTLSDEGNPDTVTIDGIELINYPKYQLISNAIKKFLSYQKVSEIGYRFQVEEPLYSYLVSLPWYGADQLYDLSLLREARANSAQ